MVEKMIFNPSGLIKDINNKEEIEVWGHDAGEFSVEEIEKIFFEVETADSSSEKS